jgi:hypothetical protein
MICMNQPCPEKALFFPDSFGQSRGILCFRHEKRKARIPGSRLDASAPEPANKSRHLLWGTSKLNDAEKRLFYPVVGGRISLDLSFKGDSLGAARDDSHVFPSSFSLILWASSSVMPLTFQKSSVFASRMPRTVPKARSSAAVFAFPTPRIPDREEESWDFPAAFCGRKRKRRWTSS